MSRPQFTNVTNDLAALDGCINFVQVVHLQLALSQGAKNQIIARPIWNGVLGKLVSYAPHVPKIGTNGLAGLNKG
jgi:hypothetical protein